MSRAGTKWQIRECREIWKEGRVWELEEGGLSVGRSEDCDIHIFSQTVESRHGVFEWSPKKEAFVVRDLGSVNGTYINNQPIRGTFAVLKHGDSIRFGYEKNLVFRVEVVDLPSTSSQPLPSPTSTAATSTATATQTSPFEPQSTQANTVPHPVNVQYLPVPSQSPTIIIPTLQPTIPYVGMPQTMAYGFPHVPGATHLYQTFQPMQHSMPTQPSSAAFQHVSPAHLLQQQAATPTSAFQNVSSTPSQTTTSTPMHSGSMTVEDIESEGTTPPPGSPVLRRPRKDGRRIVSLYDSPSLSKASSLYGSPSWWGEEDSTGGSSDGEFGPPHLGTGVKILRDLDPHKSKEQESSRTRTSITDELRKQAISNSTQERERDCESPASWSVEFGGATAKRPSRFDRNQRPKSADPSPTQVSRSTVSPVRRSKSPSVSPRQSPVLHRKTVIGGAIKRKDTSQKVTTKKPPSGLKSGQRKSTTALSATRSKHSPVPGTRSLSKEEPVSNSAIQNTGIESPPTQTAAAKETTKVDQNLTYNIAADHQDQAHSSISDLSTTSTPDRQAATPHPTGSPLKCQSQTQVTREEGTEQGDACATTFIIHGREASRPGSARKQWSSQPQPPDSLMLASIEARMRRLSKKAQGTAQAVGSLRHLETHEKRTLEASLSPLPKQDLPEWKFFNNKEVDSIFQSIRSVEKWLREIDAVMMSLQTSTGEQAGNEEVDYTEDYGSSNSEVEMLPDSMEDGVCSGSSDTSDHEKSTQ